MLLAVDTSTAVASVALFDGVVQAEHTWRAGQNHTAQLLPNVQSLLAETGVRAADLTAVGVALGPGSFNGLRVGLATAKMLGFSLGIPLVGVNTLEITAYQHREAGTLIRPVYDAGRGQIATSLYSTAGRELREVEPPRIAELREVMTRVTDATLFCGEIKESWAEEILKQGGPLAAVASPAGSLRRAGYLAELAWSRCQAGQVADPATLQPLYLRRPSVLEKPPNLESRLTIPGLGPLATSLGPRA